MKGKSLVSFVTITLLLLGVMVLPAASAKPHEGFPVGTSSLRIFCFYDANANGVYDNPVPVWVNNALIEWVQGGWVITVKYGTYSQDFITDCEGFVEIPNIVARAQNGQAGIKVGSDGLEVVNNTLTGDAFFGIIRSTKGIPGSFIASEQNEQIRDNDISGLEIIDPRRWVSRRWPV